ncbi:hypothetical protein QL285_080093 [Trifolium repens]|nr:hypothetical protein QL285_080093 [Trifolium repens]
MQKSYLSMDVSNPEWTVELGQAQYHRLLNYISLASSPIKNILECPISMQSYVISSTTHNQVMTRATYPKGHSGSGLQS